MSNAPVDRAFEHDAARLELGAKVGGQGTELHHGGDARLVDAIGEDHPAERIGEGRVARERDIGLCGLGLPELFL